MSVGNYMSSRGWNCLCAVCYAEAMFQPSFCWCCFTLAWEDKTSNPLVVVWVVTLNRLGAYSYDSLTLHLSTAVCIIEGKECLRVIHVLTLSSLVVSASVARTIRRSIRALTSQKLWTLTNPPFPDLVYLGCTQCECNSYDTIIEQYTKMFEPRISAGATEKQ